MVHGDSDNLIDSELGRKRFLLVEGGSHFSTMALGLAKYREALAEMFSLRYQ